MVKFHKATTLDKLKPGKAMDIEVDGVLIALFNVDGKIFATSDVCPHAGGSLGQGELDGCTITCPLHGWQFDVESGKCLRIPAMKVQTFPIKIEGNDILVSVDSKE